MEEGDDEAELVSRKKKGKVGELSLQNHGGYASIFTSQVSEFIYSEDAIFTTAIFLKNPSSVESFCVFFVFRSVWHLHNVGNFLFYEIELISQLFNTAGSPQHPGRRPLQGDV